MNWNSYVLRRSINIEQWLKSRGIKDSASFLNTVRSLDLEPPDGDMISSMFPIVKEQQVKEVINESDAVSPEGGDQIAARRVVGEGDGTDQRSDRKRSSKVRS